jgi:hypothetical protein
MNGVNFVLADFDPSHMYEATATDLIIANEGWNIFVNLITKACRFQAEMRPLYIT